jgi:hypothetical protein
MRRRGKILLQNKKHLHESSTESTSASWLHHTAQSCWQTSVGWDDVDPSLSRGGDLQHANRCLLKLAKQTQIIAGLPMIPTADIFEAAPYSGELLSSPSRDH